MISRALSLFLMVALFNTSAFGGCEGSKYGFVSTGDSESKFSSLFNDVKTLLNTKDYASAVAKASTFEGEEKAVADILAGAIAYTYGVGKAKAKPHDEHLYGAYVWNHDHDYITPETDKYSAILNALFVANSLETITDIRSIPALPMVLNEWLHDLKPDHLLYASKIYNFGPNVNTPTRFNHGVYFGNKLGYGSALARMKFFYLELGIIEAKPYIPKIEKIIAELPKELREKSANDEEYWFNALLMCNKNSVKKNPDNP